MQVEQNKLMTLYSYLLNRVVMHTAAKNIKAVCSGIKEILMYCKEDEIIDFIKNYGHVGMLSDEIMTIMKYVSSSVREFSKAFWDEYSTFMSDGSSMYHGHLEATHNTTEATNIVEVQCAIKD